MKIDLYNDNIGYVELLDFSRANISEKSRIDYIQKIASICYKSPAKVFDEETGKGRVIYDRLYTESLGLPSSSFEFVPVLIQSNTLWDGMSSTYNCEKYGEFVESDKYLLTNLRALLADIKEDASKFFNTSESEIAIIKKHFKVFKSKIPIFTRSQFIRHRVQWQELSRRYVSAKKEPLEFYISPKIKNLTLNCGFSINGHIKNSIDIYNHAIEQGVKPQDARQLLPQSMYTEIYSAWYPSQLKSMLDLRTQDSTQEEFRELAKAMKELTDD